MKKILIAIPTYNEKENVKILIEKILQVFEDISDSVKLIFIDDNSPDGTSEIIKQFIISEKRDNFKIGIIERPAKLGLASAYLDTWKKYLDDDFDYFLTMDADLSHDPKYIKNFLTYIEDYDVVIASRNIKGGGVENWQIFRKVLSKFGSLYARFILGVKINDFTGGFNMYTKKALKMLDLENIKSEGYSFQIEMKYRLAKAGCKIKEFPIVFVNRKFGKTKMSFKIMLEAFYKVILLKFKS